MRRTTSLYSVFIVLILLKQYTVKCQQDSKETCVIPDVQDGALGNDRSVNDVINKGDTFDITCNSGFQLGGKTAAKITCITGQMPKSCREIKVGNTVTEYVVGSEVKLTCLIKSQDQVTGIRWLKDDKNFRLQGEFKSADQPSTYQNTLTFTVASSDDAGKFKCEGTVNSAAPFDKEMYQSEVQINILSVVMAPDKNPVYLLDGEPFPLSCTFVKYGSYSFTATWTQGTSPMSAISVDDKGATISYKVNFNAGTAVGYSQEYTCQGVYKHLSSGRTLTMSGKRRVEVRGISFHPASVTRGIGTKAEFNCDAVGEVEGSVSWTIGGKPQDSSLFTTTYSKSSRLTRTKLSLESLQKQDSKVQCLVTFGGVTVKSNEAELVVFGVGIVQHPADNGFVKGTSNKLTCSVQTESGINPTIHWYWKFSPVAAEKYSTTVNADNTLFTSVLFLQNVQKSQNGEYKCKANVLIKGVNTVVESNPATIYVREVLKDPGDDFVQSNDPGVTKSFSCFFFGGNEPAGASVQSVKWYANDVDVKDVANFKIDNAKLNKGGDWLTVLSMSNISPKLAGTIKCSYECGIGPPISAETKLYVHRQVPLPSETHTASSDFTITCSAGTNEQASVSWFKNGLGIKLNDNNFKAQTATTKDFVQYNTLVVQGWSTTKDTANIKCKYTYDVTKYIYETSTKFSFKGFTTSPDRYTYFSPGQKKMHCSYGFTFTTTGPKEAKWTRNGAPVNNDARYEVDASNKQAGHWEISLLIKGSGGVVTTEDGGVFVCSFVYSDTETYQRTADLFFYDIQTLPAEPKFYDAPSVTLTCVLKSKGLSVSGVKWIKNGATTKEPAYTVKSESDSLTTYLQINEVIAANEGTFTCSFDVPGNKKLEDSMYAYIRNIEMLSEEYKVVAAGTKLELSCSVKNYTEAALVWYKDNGKQPVADHTLTYKNFILTSTLTYDPIQTANLGEYRCGIGDSRSKKSTTVSSVTVSATGATVMKGSGRATLKCSLSNASSQPSSVFWIDDNRKQYKSTDSTSDYKVVVGTFNNGEQSTSLEIQAADSAVYTCNFVVNGLTGSRRVPVTVVDIKTTSSLVHKGSDTSIQCRLEGTSTAPTVAWSGGDSGHVTTAKTDDFASKALVTSLQVKSVQKDLKYTCTYDVQGSKFAKEVQVEIYELSIPATYLLERERTLTIEVQTQPEIPDIANYVKQSDVSANVTVDGKPVITVGKQTVTITYTKVVAPMEVTYRYTDSSGTAHQLTSVVHVVEFRDSKVGISDGVQEAQLECTMFGVLTEDMKKQVSSFWTVGGKKEFKTPVISGSSITTKYDMAVTSGTVDGAVACGFSVQGKEYSHTAKLDIISIKCSEKVEIVGDKTVQLTCTISDSKHIEPVKAVWYKGSAQQLNQNLKGAGWPNPVTTTLPAISTAGSYRCSVDMGITEFTKTIAVTKKGGAPVDPVDPGGGDGDADGSTGESGKNVALIVGVTVPVIIVLIGVVVVGYCCFKKHRTRRASFNVKTLSMNSNSFNRPESLIYANDGQTPGNHRAAKYTQHLDHDQGQVSSNNLRVNYRASNQRPEPRPQTRRAAPAPPGSSSRPSTRTDHVRSPDSAGVRYNRDFDASVYSRNLAAGKHLGPTQVSDA